MNEWPFWSSVPLFFNLDQVFVVGNFARFLPHVWNSIPHCFLNHNLICYRPRMRIGINFTQVYLCLSVCLSVQAITFELLQLGTSFLVYRYILTPSRSSLSIKVIGSRSRSNVFLIIFYQNCQFYVFLFHSYMIKFQGHLKVKVKAVQYQGQLLKINFRC